MFIHGAGTGAYDEDQKLADDLQQRLGPDYTVNYPAMENEEDADYETWAHQIEEVLAKEEDAVILVGHSVGASVIIKLLSEREIRRIITGVCLISAPFWGGTNGWTYEGYRTLELPPDTTIKLPEAVPIFFYHSRDDQTVPFIHLSFYAEKIARAQLRELDGRGHQLNNDLSEVADDIKKVL